ncbi:MAG: hypothetical protein ABIK89_12120 [Planctomycetota bacterium]
MSNHSQETLPGSRVRCRQTTEELVFYLPPHAIRGWIRGVLIVTALVVFEGFLAVAVYKGWCPSVFIAVPFGIFALLASGFLFLFFTGNDLTETWVNITRERLLLKTNVWGGCGQGQTYLLNERSYAAQYWGGRDSDATSPSGIEVKSEDDTSKGTAHFGNSLSRAELEWVEWRINRFLGHATDAQAPAGVMASSETAAALIKGIPGKPLAPPEDTKIRIDEDFFETRIRFPGTVAMGSYKGIGVTVFGFVWAGLPLSVLIDRWRYLPDADAWSLLDVGILVFLGVFGVLVVFGLLLLFMGLTRLFGCSRLTISRERITFRTTLLGILPFYWKTLPTADVISVDSVKICTASRAISYGDQFRDAVRTKAEADWLAGEIALRIQAARSGARLPPLRNRLRHGQPN